MPNELTIPSLPSIPAHSPGSGGIKGGGPGPPPAVRGTAQSLANPSLRLDPALGLVVIEFHDRSGAISSSIPSPRQIEAYRMHQQTPPSQGGDATAQLDREP